MFPFGGISSFYPSIPLPARLWDATFHGRTFMMAGSLFVHIHNRIYIHRCEILVMGLLAYLTWFVLF